jgi:SAM-dependent methyltransferase
MSSQTAIRHQFLQEYRHIRHAEGRGSENSAYYRALPFCNRTDPNAAMWRMRAKTFSYFVKNVLEPVERQKRLPLDILDLGAGNCWLSHRLTLRHHRPVAIDIFSDEKDGLGAARHYRNPPATIESDFDNLPLPANRFDLAVFNASFHYSVDYVRTLAEVRRCLRNGGLVVIFDSPIYRVPEHGTRMVVEKHATFLRQYGFRSDAIPSIDFLDLPMLRRLETALEMKWQIFKPWYGWAWHLRPLKAKLHSQRPPSRFWILVGRFNVS